MAKFATCAVDTGGKFAAGAIDTGGNLPPMSLTLVVHLDSQIFEMTLVLFSGAWVKVIHEKNLKQKIS